MGHSVSPLALPVIVRTLFREKGPAQRRNFVYYGPTKISAPGSAPGTRGDPRQHLGPWGIREGVGVDLVRAVCARSQGGSWGSGAGVRGVAGSIALPVRWSGGGHARGAGSARSLGARLVAPRCPPRSLGKLRARATRPAPRREPCGQLVRTVRPGGSLCRVLPLPSAPSTPARRQLRPAHFQGNGRGRPQAERECRYSRSRALSLSSSISLSLAPGPTPTSDLTCAHRRPNPHHQRLGDG